MIEPTIQEITSRRDTNDLVSFRVISRIVHRLPEKRTLTAKEFIASTDEEVSSPFK
jgi:hypothetical protein